MGSLRQFTLLAGFILIAIPAWERQSAHAPIKPGRQVFLQCAWPTLPDQTLTVTCYLGNPNDNQSLGSITVNSPSAAGPTCNSLNYACQGRCFGCYADFDMSEDVCVDSAGRKYMR